LNKKKKKKIKEKNKGKNGLGKFASMTSIARLLDIPWLSLHPHVWTSPGHITSLTWLG
jgi:hypothetical protein